MAAVSTYVRRTTKSLILMIQPEQAEKNLEYAVFGGSDSELSDEEVESEL